MEIDWDEYEELHREHQLPPEVCSSAWRAAVPVYDTASKQVGQATSGSWSPTLKKNLALATVDREHGRVGSKLRIEVTVEYRRRTVEAIVCKKPFFDPERKRT